MLFKTAYSYKKTKGEGDFPPSLSVPDMALTPAEIMVRWAQGRPLSANNNLHYTGDEYYPDMRKLDLTEQAEIMESHERHMMSLNNKLKQRREAKRQSKEAQKQGSSEADNEATGADELP